MLQADRGEKNRPESQTMAFGENYFLIEAYATDVTDKLAIVKEFSCGASRRACVLFVWALQLNVLFVLVSVLTVMFTQHSLPSSESLTNTNNTLLLPRYQHNKRFSWRWKAILSKRLILFFFAFCITSKLRSLFQNNLISPQHPAVMLSLPFIFLAGVWGGSKHNKAENLTHTIKVTREQKENKGNKSSRRKFRWFGKLKASHFSVLLSVSVIVQVPSFQQGFHCANVSKGKGEICHWIKAKCKLS